MSPIAIHFDMMLEPEEQTRIGAKKSIRDEMRVMRLLSAYRDKCEMLVMQSQIVTALELELAPFRDKRGIGGYIDDMRNERNAALKEANTLRDALHRIVGPMTLDEVEKITYREALFYSRPGGVIIRGLDATEVKP